MSWRSQQLRKHGYHVFQTIPVCSIFAHQFFAVVFFMCSSIGFSQKIFEERRAWGSQIKQILVPLARQILATYVFFSRFTKNNGLPRIQVWPAHLRGTSRLFPAKALSHGPPSLSAPASPPFNLFFCPRFCSKLALLGMSVFSLPSFLPWKVDDCLQPLLSLVCTKAFYHRETLSLGAQWATIRVKKHWA